jgi:endonuclease I
LIKIITTSPGTRGSFNVDNIQWTTYHNSSGGAPEIDYTPPVITVNDPKTSYNVGETVNLGCTANDDVDGAVLCTYSGTVDNLTPGTYPITYTAVDSSSNEAVLVVDYVIIGTYPTSYYDGTAGLSGADLEAALRIIVNNGFSGVTYGESRYILDETDADPANPGNLILVYLQTSVSGVWDDGNTWNREHVWPQSLLGATADNDTVNIASDLHNLKPADPSENSSRNNKFYDDITASVSYEPHSDVKGDLARILFYMVVMYDYLELKDLEDFTGIGEPGLYEMGLLEVLLSWHELDPVDDFERNRNNVIYYYQGNRNPFIDHEEFVALLFEDHPYYVS